MTIAQILAAGGGGAAILMTLIQISPLKFNPWSALTRMLGRAINGEVLGMLNELKKAQQANSDRLNEHIRIDDERNADEHRARILRFNNELVRDIPHTKEEFIDILSDIDEYERYCKQYSEYKNNRAVHAIANIGRVYDDRLEKHDFL